MEITKVFFVLTVYLLILMEAGTFLFLKQHNKSLELFLVLMVIGGLLISRQASSSFKNQTREKE
jgi:hypothetical protein